MKKGLAILLYLLPLVAFAKNPTVSGYVTDAKTGERLIGATVVDLLSGAGTVTNVHGFYSLSLPSGEIRLQAGYVGYEHSTVPPFVLQKDTLVELQITSSNMLGEVVVEGQQSISGVHSVQMSAVEVPVTQIKAIPAIGGEVDVLKAIQLLPGVHPLTAS